MIATIIFLYLQNILILFRCNKKNSLKFEIMNKTLEKLCCCCSIQIGGYIIASVEIVVAIFLFGILFIFTDEAFDFPVEFVGKGF